MKKFRKLGTTFYISAMILWITPILIYGFYHATFVKSEESSEQENKMENIGNIISSKIDYENNYYISEEFLDGIELSDSYNITLLNEFGEVFYSTNKRFLKVMYSSSEVLEILRGSSDTYKTTNANVIRVYVPITYNKNSVGVVIVSQNVRNVLFNNIKNDMNMITLTLVITLLVLTYIFSRYLTSPVSKLNQSVEMVLNGHNDKVEVGDGCYEISIIRDNINNMIYRSRTIEESRKQFVADVSHELKTPLSSMKVLADALLNQKDAPKEMYDEFMSDISKEVDRESKIINDLLTMVSLDNKEKELNYELVFINNLIEQVTRLLLPLAKEKNVTLEIQSFRDVEAYIDETKIYLVIMNLIENAIKYNKEGGKVFITLDADIREFTIEIKDTGIGIPSDNIDNIFDRFYRVDKMRSRDSGGTGLGLSIVRKAIIMHGGRIRCYSQENIGTTFVINLPISKW